jgi:cytochrome bd-type quinol oxidase subunit 2
MNKMSAKSIQMFVAGALALIALVGGSIFSGLGLLIGVAMLMGREQAMFWARIYLLIGIAGAIATVCLSLFPVLPKAPHLSWWRGASDLLTPAILFWLLVWSRSRHFEMSQSSTNPH